MQYVGITLAMGSILRKNRIKSYEFMLASSCFCYLKSIVYKKFIEEIKTPRSMKVKQGFQQVTDKDKGMIIIIILKLIKM